MTAPSPWSPLRITTFRWLWLASVASSIGTWMHEAGGDCWLMAPPVFDWPGRRTLPRNTAAPTFPPAPFAQ